MSQVVADRRILRAFYTQYVAVLLIMLVFFIAAPKSQEEQSAHTTVTVAQTLQHTPFGRMTIRNPFGVGGDSVIQHTGELDAIAEIARNHDVSVEIKVPVYSESDEMRAQAFRVALRRAADLRVYFLQRHVASAALAIFVEDSAGREDPLLVAFRAQEAADETL